MSEGPAHSFWYQIEYFNKTLVLGLGCIKLVFYFGAKHPYKDCILTGLWILYGPILDAKDYEDCYRHSIDWTWEDEINRPYSRSERMIE